jgi:hypothetical protein
MVPPGSLQILGSERIRFFPLGILLFICFVSALDAMNDFYFKEEPRPTDE